MSKYSDLFKKMPNELELVTSYKDPTKLLKLESNLISSNYSAQQKIGVHISELYDEAGITVDSIKVIYQCDLNKLNLSVIITEKNGNTTLLKERKTDKDEIFNIFKDVLTVTQVRNLYRNNE